MNSKTITYSLYNEVTMRPQRNYSSIEHIKRSLGQVKDENKEVRVKNGTAYVKEKKAFFSFPVSRVRHTKNCKKLLICTLKQRHNIKEESAKILLETILAGRDTITVKDINNLDEYIKTSSMTGLFESQKNQLKNERIELNSWGTVDLVTSEFKKKSFMALMLAKYPLTQSNFSVQVSESIGDKKLWTKEDKTRIEHSISRFVNMSKLDSDRNNQLKTELKGLSYARDSSLNKANERQKSALVNFFTKIGLTDSSQVPTLKSLQEAKQRRKEKHPPNSAQSKSTKKHAPKVHSNDAATPKKTNFTKALNKLVGLAEQEKRETQPAKLEELQALFITGVHSASGASMLKKSHGATSVTAWTQDGLLKNKTLNKDGLCYGLAAKWGKDTAKNTHFFESMRSIEGFEEASALFDGQFGGEKEIIERFNLVGIETDGIEKQRLGFGQGNLQLHILRQNLAESGQRSGHAVATYSSVELGKEKYAFYDPNIGEVTFSSQEQLEGFTRDAINILYDDLPAQFTINCNVPK